MCLRRSMATALRFIHGRSHMKAESVPDLNEFLIRHIPLSTAVWAVRNWNKLTVAQKRELNFDVPETH